MFMTRDISDEVHVRLVTPLAQRVESMKNRVHLSAHDAAMQLKRP